MPLTEVCRACAALEAQSARSQEKLQAEDKLGARGTGLSVARGTSSCKLLDHSLASDVSEPVIEDVSVLSLSPLSPLSASPPRRGALLLTWDSQPD
jgi:hypothetical protein